MKYQIVLQGNKNITVTEEQKKQIESHWISKDGFTLGIGNNTIDTKSIKGIFEIPEVDFSIQEKINKEQGRAFYEQLEKSSVWSVEDKSKRDMRIRILPGWLKSGGKREDREMMNIYTMLTEFFTQNIQYPYCPAVLWWPIIKERMREFPKMSIFYKYVFLHDGQVYSWLKNNGKETINASLL